jgi:DNA polymerase-4
MFIHIDIDAFFASAERAFDPSLCDIPMAVGSRSNLEIFSRKRVGTKLMNENSGAFVAPVFYTDREKSFEEYFIDRINGEHKIRGIITSASYEARACGVKTAMPIAQALQLCPEMIIIPSHYKRYHTLSQQLFRYMQRKIPKVEQYSIDEFFGDLSGWIEPTQVFSYAKSLQKEIMTQFSLPVSIGISEAKWIAKLATESAKPYGIFEVKEIDSYIEHIPIEKFPGIGKGFQHRLKSHYISTLGEVKRNSALLYQWKKPGIQLYKRITGTDRETVETKVNGRKSIGISRTFDPIYNIEEIRRRIMVMARHISYMVLDTGVNPTSYSLKINYEYGIKVKKSLTCERLFSETLYKELLETIYQSIMLSGRGTIKLSLQVGNFSSQQKKTLSLLDYATDRETHKLTKTIHKLRKTFGIDIIKTGNEL